MKITSINYSTITTGVVSLAMVASLGMGGVASANKDHGGNNVTPPSNINECKKGGWKDLGFKNQGQCIAYYNEHHKGEGYGYKGDGDNDHDHGHHFDFGFFGRWFSHFGGWFNFGHH